MEKKMTKREYFAILRTMVEDVQPTNLAEIVAFIDHEVELLNKKTSKSSQTKTQKENVSIMETITAVLSDFGKPVTISEMQKDERLSIYSNQKLSALVRQMPNVIRIEKKNKAYFAIKE
jgi:hypothetical protein